MYRGGVNGWGRVPGVGEGYMLLCVHWIVPMVNCVSK